MTEKKIYNNLIAMVAMTEKTRAIGRDNHMLYHLPEDLKYYKETTEGHTIVCGYNTWLSFPTRPLPRRKNIVLSRKNRELEGAILMHSIDEVLAYADKNPDERIFICGGDKIYSQFMPHVGSLFITLVEEFEDPQADSFFPEVDSKTWVMTKCFEPENYDRKNAKPSICFSIFERADGIKTRNELKKSLEELGLSEIEVMDKLNFYDSEEFSVRDYSEIIQEAKRQLSKLDMVGWVE